MSEQKLIELRIEQLELDIARQKAPRPKEHILASPIVLAIAGATVTALVSVVGNLAQLNANRTLERGKLESALILKATEAATAQERIDGLQFLVKAGLISDADRKISSLRAADVPQLQTSVAPATAVAGTRPPPSAYRQLFDAAVLTEDGANMVAGYGKKLLEGRPRYEAVAAKTGVPWFVIGILHMAESRGNFAVHLSNGDPLSERTTHAPRGRPTAGTPPFTWEDSAIDTLATSSMADVPRWSVEETLYQLERWNGMGYWRRGINSPYLWGGSNLYQSGKFVGGATFDPAAKSRQIGVAVLLKFAVPKKDLDALAAASAGG